MNNPLAPRDAGLDGAEAQAPAEAAALFAPLATADDGETLARLHARLARDADRGGDLDIAYRRFETPVGELLLAATQRGLVRVAFAGQDGALAELAARISPRILHAPARLDPVVRELDEYFAGQRRAFDVPLDLRLARGFRAAVVERLSTIPYGTTATYTQVAALAGNPRATRAVGTACALNPLPVVVPCHRVVRTDGSMGGYVGGLAVKQRLLALEAA
ncbi:methylated-DNA--[protein]-cysteine S-methyltransferase [Georgenia faecalis]|uniref:Methylated-DNA--protein-cysteine methyltransferase n=1 Tax=Georgenia faecalis TaxID=2483799 RepID=A0ABV9D986_9MICO|nr:methylated-DNA--[protein]-cysteine S-methyltransferase [Georgenia faecalis]